jgi:predicted nucleotidyltransferase
MYTPHQILKVLVGSQAHGLAGPESDADYRSVFVIPTAELLRLDAKYQGVRMSEGDEDETSWEVGRFLSLAVHNHPLILETFLAPIVSVDQWGTELRSLFSACWEPGRAYEAFTGYAVNQRKKLLEKKDSRPAKYAVAYVRVLYGLCELLETGTFTIRISETRIGETIAKIKAGALSVGQIIDLGEDLAQEAARRLTSCTHRPDLESVNAFLIRLRKAFLA